MFAVEASPVRTVAELSSHQHFHKNLDIDSRRTVLSFLEEKLAEKVTRQLVWQLICCSAVHAEVVWCMLLGVIQSL